MELPNWGIKLIRRLEEKGFEAYAVGGCVRDKVGFTRSLSEDLSRRDFTVNAMAFHPERGLVDCFGGKEDLKNRILKCVGEPERRFREDA